MSKGLIREARNLLEDSIFDVADSVGCNFSYVSLVECNLRPVVAGKAQEIVRLLAGRIATNLGSTFTPSATPSGDIEQLRILVHQAHAKKLSEVAGA